MSIRILLVDDHQLFLVGLRSILEEHPDMEVVAEAKNGRRALELAKEKVPDVVVMDISMPGLNGIDATRQIIAQIPTAKVLALSMHSSEDFVEGMLRAGASGYLLKDSTYEEFVVAIRAVVSGQTYLCPAIAGEVVEGYINSGPAKGQSAMLDPREREVLQLVAESQASKEIARTLCLGVRTVENYRQSVMDKLNIHTVAGLTKFAIRAGLTSLEE